MHAFAIELELKIVSVFNRVDLDYYAKIKLNVNIFIGILFIFLMDINLRFFPTAISAIFL